MMNKMNTLNMIFDLKNRKGMDMPIKVVSMIILGLLIVAFLYAGYSTWFEDIASGFVGSVEYPQANTG